MRGIHGGDIYSNRVNMDFSVNVNPLGMPKAVAAALHDAVDMCVGYPDMAEKKLKSAVGRMLKVPEEYLLFGNGASELFMGIVHGMKPRKILIPVPSFYGYEYVSGAVGGEVVFYPLREEKDFLPGEDFPMALTEDVELLFLANPNNPTGRLMSKEYLRRLLNACRQKGITVVLDECFIEFCGKDFSMVSEIEEYDNLLLVRAFTKIYAIPGVRLGYLIGSDRSMLSEIKRQLPEWNLSVFAHAAGSVCAGQSTFITETIDYVKRERQFLTDNLRQMNLRAFPGEANFILLYSDIPLYESLLERGILIRDCGNFRGLSKGYYRIAVKSRKENETLLKVLRELTADFGKV